MEDTKGSEEIKSSPKKGTKKKVSKKQKEAAADKRKREERDREAKEREEMVKADWESRAYEREVKYQIEEKERREWEQAQIAVWEEEVNTNTKEWQARQKQQEGWKVIIAASKTVNPRVEAELNTWINLWKESEELVFEDTLQQCQQAENIIREMHLLPNQDEQTVVGLRQLGMQKIDQMTAHIIQNADENADHKNELLLCHKTEDISYGLWVNITKNPRIKRLDFAGISISCEIPKSLALTSVAIRAIHFSNDIISYNNSSTHVALGGVLFLELLALPPPPKRVKGWTLRQVTSLSSNVSRLNYPPSTGIGVEAVPINATQKPASVAYPTNAWPPLRVSYVLPPHIVVREQVPVIGYWDQETTNWRTEGISDVSFDAPTKTLVFNTLNVKALAIIQNRNIDIPYSNWVLRPTGRNEAVFSLTTKTQKLVEIKIGDGFCRLYRSRDPELRHLEESKFSPNELLQRLYASGINILPNESTGSSLHEAVCQKDAALERKLYREIALMSSGFGFAWSKWNNQPHTERKFVFQARFMDHKAPMEEEADTEDPEGKAAQQDQSSPWKTCLYQERSCFLLRTTDKSPKYNEDLLEGAKLHQHLLHCLNASVAREQLGPEGPQRAGSVAFTETIESLLNLTKFLTFSQ